MRRLLLVVAATALAVLPSSQGYAQHSPNRSDIFSILATAGGYYVRTVSPKGDRIAATCQLIRKGAWDFSVKLYPTGHVIVKTGTYPVLKLSSQWAYPLRARSDGSFFWMAPNPAAFALFLHRASSMGWGDRFVSRELNINFQSHGSDDAGTLAAFAHLCRLPGISPNAY